MLSEQARWGGAPRYMCTKLSINQMSHALNTPFQSSVIKHSLYEWQKVVGKQARPTPLPPRQRKLAHRLVRAAGQAGSRVQHATKRLHALNQPAGHMS